VTTDPSTPRRDGDLLRDPRRGLLVAGLLLLGVAVLTVPVVVDRGAPPLLDGIDRWWRDFARPPSPWAESASQVLKVLGSGLVMVPLRVAVAAWLLVRRRYVDLAAWLLAWAAADLLTLAMKPTIARMRPDLSHASSFPSAHAKTAAQVAVGLVLVATSPWRRRVLPWTLAVAWIVAMGVSRTLLDEHFFSDVVTGSMLGAGCAVGVAALVQRRRDRREARAPGYAPGYAPGRESRK
jgi:membrane-associated phospholipid phosphatase